MKVQAKLRSAVMTTKMVRFLFLTFLQHLENTKLLSNLETSTSKEAHTMLKLQVIFFCFICLDNQCIEQSRLVQNWTTVIPNVIQHLIFYLWIVFIYNCTLLKRSLFADRLNIRAVIKISSCSFFCNPCIKNTF